MAKRLHVSSSARAAFPQRLRSIMSERGLTVAETARLASAHMPEGQGLSRATLRHYLRGRSLPRQRYLHALALALGVEPSHLTRETEHALPPGSSTPGKRVVVKDLGGEAHLFVEQRVPWDLALAILKLVTDPGEPDGPDNPVER